VAGQPDSEPKGFTVPSCWTGREGQRRVSAFECLGTYIIGTQVRIFIVRSIFTKGFCLASGWISALKDEGVPVGTGGGTVGVAMGVGRAPRCECRVGGKDVEEEGQNERKTAHGEDRERERQSTGDSMRR
jgi:hypothetical protein